MNALPPDEKIPEMFAHALAANPRAAASYNELDAETRRFLCETIASAQGCGARSILIKGAIRELLAD